MAEKMATREAYGQVLLELGEQYDNLIVMDADLSGSTKTKDFGKKYGSNVSKEHRLLQSNRVREKSI